MLSPSHVHATLDQLGVAFYAGVPDSLLKDLCAWIADAVAPERHVITPNEGCAVALAAGWHLATGQLGAVYMQNSGQGNAVNPLLSLADPAVYGIPMLLIVGWRGEPGVKDEPQHVTQGRVCGALFDAMEIPYAVLPPDADAAADTLGTLVAHARARSGPVAVLVRKGTFSPYSLKGKPASTSTLTREAAIATVAAALPDDALVVASTGMIGRELYEHRVATGRPPSDDFLTVGGMGHASHLALGMALAQPTRPVVCLDGDGAVLMHMGALAAIGARRPSNLVHVVLNNGAHDSVGGQPTDALTVDLPGVARACGYASTHRVEGMEDLAATLAGLASLPRPAFLEVRVALGSRADLGRPKASPRDAKDAFMQRAVR